MLQRSCAGLAVVFAIAASTSAQTWVGPNGSFQNSANWSPATVPGPASVATFSNSASNFLVSLDSDWTIASLSISTGTVNFAMNGHTFTSSGVAFANVASQPLATFVLTNGTYVLVNSAALGGGANSNFALTVDGATFSGNNFTDMASGSLSSVSVIIRNGGRYSASGASGSFIGDVGSAIVTVDGAASSFTLGNSSRLGNVSGSSGTLNVTNGGTFRTQGNFNIGTNAGSSGTLSTNSTGSSWTHTNGTIAAGGGTTAAMNINAGTSMTVTGISSAAGILLNTGSTMTVAGTVTVSGVGTSGIILSGGTLTINTFGSIITDNFSRNVGAAVPTFNDGLIAVNKVFDLGVSPLTLSGSTATANPTLQIQNGATATGVTTLIIGNTASRRGSLNILGGATATFSNTLTVGNLGTGTALLDGAGTKLISSQAGGTAIHIGSGGTGTLTVQNGATYQGDPIGTNIVLGQAAAGVGTLNIIGTGSSVTTGGVSVGQAGSGSVNVSSGGTFTIGRVQIGENVGGAGGIVTVSGIGSTMTSPSGLFIGGTALTAGANNSQLVVANGGSVSATTILGTQSIIYAGGTLTINGGMLTTGNLTRLGTLALNDGTLTVNGGFLDAGSTATPLTVQANAAGTLATLQISSSTTSNIGTLAVGNTRPGAVNIGSGGNVSANALTFATTNTGNSSVTLSGTNAMLSVNTPLTFGPNGTSSLTIGTGATVSAPNTLALGASGTVTLTGGTLSIGGIAANGGVFNWANGTVTFPGSVALGSAELTLLVGNGGTLSAGRTLRGSNFSGNPLTLNGSLTLTGGSISATDVTNSTTLTIAAGSVVSTNPAVNTSTGVIAVANGAALGGGGGAANSGEIQLGGGTARIVGAVVNTGRIVGGGTIAGSLTNNGTVTVDAGQRILVAASGTNNSNATITLNGGTMEFTGSVTNLVNGFIAGRGTLNTSTSSPGGPGISNFGVISFSGGNSDIRGDATNTASGVITNSGGGTVTFYDDVVNNGQVRTFPGGRTVFLGDQSGSGSFPGGGVVEYAGDLRPGNSPAKVDYGGTVVLNASVKTTIELGGTTVGSQYDRLAISGTAFLDGQLTVALINGFVPAVGQRFDVVTYGSRVGAFASFSGLDLGNGTTLVPDYDAGAFFLTVQPVPEPGLMVFFVATIIGVTVRRNAIGLK